MTGALAVVALAAVSGLALVLMAVVTLRALGAEGSGGGGLDHVGGDGMKQDEEEAGEDGADPTIGFKRR